MASEPCDEFPVEPQTEFWAAERRQVTISELGGPPSQVSRASQDLLSNVLALSFYRLCVWGVLVEKLAHAIRCSFHVFLR